MAQKDATAIAADWSGRLAQSTEKIRRGVQGVSVAPGQAASRNKAGYVAGVMAAQDKWARNVASVTLADWTTAMVEKGIPRIASGATAAQDKFRNFMVRLLPFIESGKAGLPARGNLEQNIARSAAWIRHMSTFGGRTA